MSNRQRKIDSNLLRIIAFFILAAVCAALLFTDIIKNGEVPSRLWKYAVVTGGFVAAACKLISDRKKQKVDVRKIYGDKIGNAFTENKKLSKLLNEALTDFYNDDYNSAIEKLKSLNEQAITNEEKRLVLFFMGISCKKMGNTHDAVYFYNQALNAQPGYAPALSNLSTVYYEQGNYYNALKYAEEAIKFDSTNPFAYNNLAYSYLQIFNLKSAKENAVKALELNGNMPSAETLLAMVYTAEGKGEQAALHIDRSVSLGNDRRNIMNSINEFVENYNRNKVTMARAEKWRKKTGIPSIKITLGSKRGKSIIGGKINETAPVGENGEKMRLLAAIFCSELPETSLLPKKGVLRFYITPDDYFGANFDNFNELNVQKNFRVLYDEDEIRFVTTLTKADDNDGTYFPVNGSYRPHFTLKQDYMGWSDHRFISTVNEIMEENETEDDYLNEEFTEKFINDGHKLLGYPCFTQEDPRGDGLNYEKYDTLLFQLDSDFSGKDEKVMFGDAGVCNFFIPSEKLKVCDFSDILYTWDCY